VIFQYVNFDVNALLDRAYGKPAVKREQEIVDLPPVVIQLTSDQWRATNLSFGFTSLLDLQFVSSSTLQRYRSKSLRL